MKATRQESTPCTAVLYMACELGWTSWKLGFSVGPGQKPRYRTIPARDLEQLEQEIAAAKKRFGLAGDAPVVSCYEAGRDGWWLHRYLESRGIVNLVVDSSSIEVNRRRRRAKSDGLDAGKLLAMLMRFANGEPKVWSVVRAPTVQDEDDRQLHRELLSLKSEQTRHINRIKGLLAGWGLKPIPTGNMKGMIDPREEWRQIFNEAWRLQRDFFYDAGLHGVDWEAVRERYGAMVDDCVTREDLGFVISEMIAELNVGHAYYFGGDVEPGTPSENVGLLGCDFELAETDEGTAYRITKIYEGGPWDADARGPLSQPGIDVKEGDFLLAVNGLEIDTSLDPWAPFIGLAGEVTEITVSERPVIDEEDETLRRILIEPAGGESDMRYRAWVESKRKMVEEMTDGRVGYIYVPNTGVQGQNELFRQFFGQRHKDGLIIDERWNGGGQIPTRFIELLNRPRTNYWARRHGNDWPWPPDSHQGPKVMLINGLAGSGGDMFPALFRQAGLGPLIGTRTWGGLVGISGNPGLIDGGFMTVPTFGFYETDGTWGIEGHGVDPDIEVIDDPSKMHDGADPQLEKAVEVILSEIQRNPYSPPQRPASPDRSGMGITEEDK